MSGSLIYTKINVIDYSIVCKICANGDLSPALLYSTTKYSITKYSMTK